FRVNTFTLNNQRYATVAAESNGDFVVVWQSYSQDGPDEGVFGRRFSSSGIGLAIEFQVNTYTIGDQRYPAVASDPDGDFVVAWQRFDGSSVGVFRRRFSSDCAAVGGEFLVNTFTLENQRYPSL